MAATLPRPNWLQRLNQQLAGTRVGAWLFAPTLHYLDTPVLRWSKGRWSVSGIVAGFPVVLLTSTGAKSQQPRTMPLIGIPDGDKVVLIGTNFGRSFLPGWYYNLRAYPEATVLTPRGQGQYTAREANEAERERYWQMALEIYSGYAEYKKRIGDRFIPILVLTPAAQ